MKTRLSLLIIILFVSSSSLFSQFRFSYGAKAGGASTNLTGVGLKDFIPTPKVKFVGGLITNFAYGSRLALQVEALYSGKGSAFKYYADNSIYVGKASVEEKLGYFAVPVMLQFKMGDKSNYFHFDGGIVYNTLIHDKYKGTIIVTDDKGNEVEHEMSIDQSPAKTDFSWAFGIGLVANGLNFDFRYEIGTDAVFQKQEGNPEIINRSFQVSVGYTLVY
jgi:hypothetical protein